MNVAVSTSTSAAKEKWNFAGSRNKKAVLRRKDRRDRRRRAVDP